MRAVVRVGLSVGLGVGLVMGPSAPLFAWGMDVHRAITRRALEGLPAPLKAFYAERIDDLVTVYYSHETNEIVGSLIKCVSKFYRDVVQKVPGLKIEIHDGRLRLVHIFRAKLWTSDLGREDITTLTYQKLLLVAEASNVETELVCV